MSAFDRFDATAAHAATDRLKALLNELRALTARRGTDQAAVLDDGSRTAEYKRDQVAVIAADYSKRADQIVQQSGAYQAAEALLQKAPTVAATALAHRGRFTVTGTDEAAQGAYWVLALQRWPLGELDALCSEAAASNRLGLADAVRREACMRLEAARLRGDAAHTAEEAIAKATADTIAAAAAPELLAAQQPIDELKQTQRLLDVEWRKLRASSVPPMRGTKATEGATDPLTRLQAHREIEAARKSA